MAYVGEERFVKCAEQRRRLGTCSDLKICVEVTTEMAHPGIMSSLFPPSFLDGDLDVEDALNKLREGSCKVVVSDLFRLLAR